LSKTLPQKLGLKIGKIGVFDFKAILCKIVIKTLVLKKKAFFAKIGKR
jgi:hypothetical protein